MSESSQANQSESKNKSLSDFARHPYAPWALALLACVLRFHRIEPEFRSSDAALSAATAIGAVCSNEGLSERLNDVVFFKLGAVQPLLLFAHGFLTNAFGGTLDAATWGTTGVLVACASVWCAYWLMRDLSGPHAGFLAGLLFAVSPAHIFTGRSLAAPWAHELTLQFALLLTACRHFRNPKLGSAIVLYSLWAVYIWCGNQMFGIVPVLGYALLTAFTHKESSESAAVFLRTRLVSPGIAIFAASAAALWYATSVAHKGHLYHALVEKKKVPGLYVGNWLSDLMHNLGYGPGVLVLAALVALPFLVRRWFDWRFVPLVYCLCYSLPFWFLISPETTQTLTQGYSIYGISGLMLVFVVSVSHAAWPDLDKTSNTIASAGVLAASAALLLLLIGTGSSVYRYYPGDLLGVKAFQGSYGSPIGASAAALFIQQHLEPRRGHVFSDASRGTGLEPPVMDTYFRRASFALLDTGNDKTPYRLFGKREKDIAFLVTKPQNVELVKETFPEFHRRAIVFSQSGEKQLLEVYAREPGIETALNARDGIDEYAEGFPTLCTKLRKPPKGE